MNKHLVSGILFIIIAGTIGYFGFSFYSKLFNAPDNSPHGQYSFTVNKGDRLETIANKLQSDKVIISAQGLAWQAKLNSMQSLQLGQYTIDLPASPESIVRQINNQTIEKLDQISKDNAKIVVKVTLLEGDNLDQMISKLVKAEVATKVDLESFAKNPDNFSKAKYKFLPTPLSCTYGDITKCAKYYPEGYLYPDTYNFVKNSTAQEVYEKMLNNFNTKVWSKVKDEVGNKDFYKVITMASVLEKETGRNKGVTAETIDELNGERKIIAQVFYNRLNQKMKWQSDVTAEYGTGRKLCQQTFKVESCMNLDSQTVKHLYNTYIVSGYPIGPVTNPQFDNIEAVLNPTPNNYLYFVADVVGKKYFASTDSERAKIISQVNKINRELGL